MRNRKKLLEKRRVLLQQIDDAIAQNNSSAKGYVELTSSMLAKIILELNALLRTAVIHLIIKIKKQKDQANQTVGVTP